ncbi:hypothetical protein EDC04DRAFT_2606158 [Pisolithus marmoratus]|nr:hypothetical protein EDC04DRAFT_2606158 [Pisolithus marmoratus]
MSTADVQILAQPLGDLAAHGYHTEDVEHIIQAHRHVHNGEDFIASLAGQDIMMSYKKLKIDIKCIQQCMSGTSPKVSKMRRQMEERKSWYFVGTGRKTGAHGFRSVGDQVDEQPP